ncbi:MAG: V-type ATPase subunit [Clostridia bacterium]|nr:V-type ATPase subunit [Clostridia bacterium]
MNKTKYTYAVARIRANDARLLHSSDYDMLINAGEKDTVIRILNEKGWNIDPKNIFKSLENEAEVVWSLIEESVPDASLIEALITENDFYNLKAALKANFSDLKIEKYYTYPCTFDTSLLTYAVTHNNFRNIPVHLRPTAEKAYKSYTENNSGQDMEIIIDKACIEMCLDYADKADSELLKSIMLIRCVQSNIKIAERCVLCGKTKDFTSNALCDCPGIDNNELIDTVKDREKLSQYISETQFSFMKNAVTGSFTEFENFCNDYIITLTKQTKWDIDGPDPVISYWIIKSNEIRNARVIISAKENGLSADEIRKRVRGADV